MSILQKIGISKQRAASYAKNGWLTRVAPGVYIFPDEELSFASALSYLSQLIAGLHIGGYSSLTGTVGGSGADQVVLWGEARVKMPRWFSERFTARYVNARLFEWEGASPPIPTLIEVTGSLSGIKVSTPERAVLEMLYEVYSIQTLDIAQSTFYQVTNLRPEVVGPLLQCCTSVKVVRLFLKLARQTPLLNVEELLERYRIRVGSNSRWTTRLEDGSLLSLKPYG